MRKHHLVKHLALTTGRGTDVLNRYTVIELRKMFDNPYELSYDECRNINVALRSGGASYRPLTGELNTEFGYMVAVEGFGKIIPRVWASEDLRLVLNQWLKEISYTGDSRYFIGIWEHENQYHLDLSQRCIDLEAAIIAGKQRNQLAIYDCKNKKDISTK